MFATLFAVKPIETSKAKDKKAKKKPDVVVQARSLNIGESKRNALLEANFMLCRAVARV